MTFYSVKTRASEEQTVVDMIVDKGGENIHAAMAPKGITGYVIVEAETPTAIDQILDEVPNAQKLLTGEVAGTEVMDFLEPPSDIENIAQNDLVEITAKAFSGEKARVTSIDEKNSRVTVEVVDSAVPIPVELSGSQVRRLDSDERN